ncbi:MAG TPA: hypothetical protein VGH80_08200 [Xanthomonadaceae bacterium]|jgi:hypothetical protein
MKRNVFHVLAGLILAAACAHAAGDVKPPVGSYGFDSLKPETTKCAKLDAAAIARLSGCTFAKNNNFGDDREGWACHVGKRTGFMAYRTLSDCKAEIELERANGD